MTGLSHTAATFIAQHAAWAGLALGLVTFGESMVVVGAFLPATVMLLAAGGMIAAGVLEPISVFGWALVGAILGDALSYWLGRRLGARALRHPLLSPHHRLVARTRLLTRRHGVASLFIGRFAGPLRAFIPVAAGMARMPARHFHLANIGSAVVWVAAFLTPGYLAARGVSAIPASTLIGVLAGLGAAAAAILAISKLRGWRPLPRALQTTAGCGLRVAPC
ncbi:DedA family protein [Caulobacter sp. CCNWLY153]|uniref:DedA family protein n=1 Tax=Caulobacter radicis TaxID=2172650 RepID=A0A2T9IYT1_9CAUL|nr:DedA family protein [Caulobacter radicis]PVM72367.1 DedA family protein [Caulobacter radicis]